MGKKEEKTNVMRLLDQAKIEYKHYCYAGTDAVGGMEVVEVLHQDPDQAFKTLVTVGKSGEHYVFVIPVNQELDLKKAAEAGRGEIHRDDQVQGIAAVNRLYSWRMFTTWNEEAVPYILPSDRQWF